MRWDSLQVQGAGFGYHPNASKTNLAVKEEHVGRARELFADTDINIATEGKHHLGATVGSRSYTEEYVVGKVAKWSEEIKKAGPYCPDTAPCSLLRLHSWSF